jgi:hypothetical protein
MKPNFAKLKEPVIEVDEPVIDIGEDGTALEFFQSVYRRKDLPLHTRMRAARDAIPYESPRLQATAVIELNSFAARLEQRLQRNAETKLIESKPIIDSGPIEEPKEEGAQPKVIEPPMKKVTDPALPFTTFRRLV